MDAVMFESVVFKDNTAAKSEHEVAATVSNVGSTTAATAVPAAVASILVI